MTQPDAIAAALRAALPSHLHAPIPALAQVLTGALTGQASTITDPDLLPLLASLRDTPLALGDRPVTVEAIAGDQSNAQASPGIINCPTGATLQVFVQMPPSPAPPNLHAPANYLALAIGARWLPRVVEHGGDKEICSPHPNLISI